MKDGLIEFPYFNLDTEAILRKAEGKGTQYLTYESSAAGIKIVEGHGRVLAMTKKNGYLIARIEDWRVFLEEMKYILDTAEMRSRR
jgi:hypothetical protein